MNEKNPYEEIINLPHHTSVKHPMLGKDSYAAQFSPFAALVGYEDVIDETARLTVPKRELDESEKAELDRKVGSLISRLGERPVVRIEYFVPDERKDGGKYATKSGAIVKITPVRKTLTLDDGTVIRFENVADISGDLFDGEI